jgi:signal transduction histidine kinase
LVTVGDAESTPSTESLVAAAREAIVNAAKHSGADHVAVYAEALPERVTVFVRDRGRGFDVESVPVDRRGIRDSIMMRLERSGGRASVTSRIGEGTEVELVIER